jgi:hypothetical protein
MPNSYEGMYSSGTMSYMLDSSSMVFYFVDSTYKGSDYWHEPKINRQMFHYGNHKLIQARLYPQSNDGNGEIYKPYRNIVQEIMATICGFPNFWTNKKGTSEIYKHVWSSGTHYRDYTNFDSCNISFAKDQNIDGAIYIGHDPICIECGGEHTVEDNINCCRGRRVCNCCGDEIYDDDDVYYVGDGVYCCDCVTYCEECGEYELNENTHYVESIGGYVCNYCLDNYYTYCPHCERYVHHDNTTYIDSEDRYVCDDCVSELYEECERCGGLYRSDNMYYHNDEYLCETCLAQAQREEKEEDDE